MGGELEHSDQWEIMFILRNSNPVLVPDFRRAGCEGLKRNLKEVNWGALGVDEGQDSGLQQMPKETV